MVVGVLSTVLVQKHKFDNLLALALCRVSRLILCEVAELEACHVGSWRGRDVRRDSVVRCCGRD